MSEQRVLNAGIDTLYLNAYYAGKTSIWLIAVYKLSALSAMSRDMAVLSLKRPRE